MLGRAMKPSRPVSFLIAAALLFGFASAAPAQETIGDFTFQERSDPLTDAHQAVLLTPELDPPSDREGSLVWGCDDEEIRLLLNADAYLGSGTTQARYRFGEHEPSRRTMWFLSGEGTEAHLLNPQQFTIRAQGVERLVLRTWDYQGASYTYEFGLKDLKKGLEKLPCTEGLRVQQHLTGDSAWARLDFTKIEPLTLQFRHLKDSTKLDIGGPSSRMEEVRITRDTAGVVELYSQWEDPEEGTETATASMTVDGRPLRAEMNAELTSYMIDYTGEQITGKAAYSDEDRKPFQLTLDRRVFDPRMVALLALAMPNDPGLALTVYTFKPEMEGDDGDTGELKPLGPDIGELSPEPVTLLVGSDSTLSLPVGSLSARPVRTFGAVTAEYWIMTGASRQLVRWEPYYIGGIAEITELPKPQ